MKLRTPEKFEPMQNELQLWQISEPILKNPYSKQMFGFKSPFKLWTTADNKNIQLGLL